jgi:hypothetical protein
MCPACKGVLEVRSKSWRNLEKAVGTIFRSEVREQHLAEMSEPDKLSRPRSPNFIVLGEIREWTCGGSELGSA